MRRIIPADIYREKPCSMVAVGCALGISDESALEGLRSPFLRSDGYLSLKGMDTLIKANAEVVRCESYRKGSRPMLCDWAHAHEGVKAVVCCLGHFVYFDGHDYHSFLWSGSLPVVATWILN